MNYRMRVNLGPLDFNITTETLPDLLKQYSDMGGNSTELVDRIKATVARWESDGTDAAVSFGAPAGTDWLANPAADSRVTEPAPVVEDNSPWGNAAPSQDSGKVDPWTGTPVTDSKPAARPSAPRGATPVATQGAATEVDRWGNEWTTGLPDAPNCDGHNIPAARVKAKSGPNSKTPGKLYTQWRCAEGAPSGDYRNKCDFRQFPN